MKVLFDHNVPRKLRSSLEEHEVRTAEEMQWHELANGDLISAAETAGFELMVTCDKNLSYQQNLKGRSLALIVLAVNNWNILKGHTDRIAASVARATPGSFQEIAFGPFLVDKGYFPDQQ